MARITVEDCLENVENRFELISLASKRAKQIVAQRKSLLDNYKNRPIVMALREIAAKRVWSVMNQD
ncbi:MAG: DNA-directed RNA polymerase subunit omega [Deltaproteobacteria bacterium]|nr:DNA-directed RNA polymerase subunit omega [Deltaproteobacteria bacterium]